jgi:hypothetical protein
MVDPFEKFNTTPPVAQETATTGEQNTATATTEQNAVVTPNDSTPTTPDTTQAAPIVDEFIENFNKRFNTQYKGDDEIKPLFELPKKVTDYEQKLKDRDDLAKSVEQYKKDLDDVRRAESSKYLEDPLMQQAWLAKELKKKYPDKDPWTLQEIAMSDVSKISDLDAVAKERKIKYPSMPLENIKKVILSDLGIDATTAPEEWDSLAKDKLTMMAGDARENIKKLTQGIELPKVETQEQVQERYNADIAKRADQAKPFKDEYSKFDKFSLGEGLDYTVEKEFQDKLPDMFDAFILQAGNEPTPENIQTLKDLRDAFFYNSHKKEIYDVMYKDAETKIKKALDERLGNTQLPNTATASDGAIGEKNNLPGATQFVQNFRGTKVKQI